ncbi:C40 family peptidase [Rubritalea spongiae]|uniref:C40 family peptidase n=1 Tax=Rubritalea spongiae TaxID=430797 RepID=A0ABW5E1I5_9BACT
MKTLILLTLIQGLFLQVINADGIRPASLEYDTLQLPENLARERTDLIKKGLALSKEHGWLRYTFGSADPEKGGLDCSGALYFLLRKSGLEPPRSSSAQYLWVRENSTFTEVGKSITSLDNPIFENLLPGDLLFWSGTYHPTDHRKTQVSHAAIYAGKDANGTHIMLNSSDGRTYLRKKQSGYGIFEFRLPSATSKSTFVGFGTPPGLIAEPQSDSNSSPQEEQKDPSGS